MWVRIVTAVAALVSAVVHLWLWWVENYRDIDVIGRRSSSTGWPGW